MWIDLSTFQSNQSKYGPNIEIVFVSGRSIFFLIITVNGLYRSIGTLFLFSIFFPRNQTSSNYFSPVVIGVKHLLLGAIDR